jgi:hypothetical protein
VGAQGTAAEEAQELPLGRALLFGAGAAAVLGTAWYLIETYWLPVPFMVFAVGWLTALAVTFGAGRRRGRPLQWISLGLTVATTLIVLFLRLGLADPLGFPNALADWFVRDPLVIVFSLLGLWYAFSTPAARPQRRPQPTPAQESGIPAGGTTADAESRAQSGGEDVTAAEGEGAAPAEGEKPAPVEDPSRRCARCQTYIPPGQAIVIPGAMRRASVLLCTKCKAELDARFTAETEDIKTGPAGLFGAGAAAAIAAIWYILGRGTRSPFLGLIGFAAGWIIAEAVRYGAGKKRGRALQLTSVALTFVVIVGVNVALALGNPDGAAAGFAAQFADPLTDVIYALGLVQAYTTPAPRRLGGIPEQQRQQPQP